MKIKGEFQWKYDPHCRESGKGAVFTSTWKLNLFILLSVVVVKVLKFERDQFICKVSDFKGLYKKVKLFLFAPFSSPAPNSWNFFTLVIVFSFLTTLSSFLNYLSCSFISKWSNTTYGILSLYLCFEGKENIYIIVNITGAFIRAKNTLFWKEYSSFIHIIIRRPTDTVMQCIM